jgi:hypothetical protein
MHRRRTPASAERLLPAGRRWGFGAHTVLPYLTLGRHDHPGEPAAEGEIRNPVFPQMESTLRKLQRRH